ncbi:hypothetical protein Tco_0140628 [Tanacetum coccineum]
MKKVSAPEARLEAIRMFLALAIVHGLYRLSDDVKKCLSYGKMMKKSNTPIETQKPLVKDEEASDVDVHLYRSMIGSLMYVTASRPDIMFAVCACSRFQVTPKTSHLIVVKRIFRRLITWQCKKQTIVATSTTEAEYVAAASCCGQVLWIQNQMLDSGDNFMTLRSTLILKSPFSISKKIAQVVRAWIKSKNSLVKHFEDMRLCRPSKEYLQFKASNFRLEIWYAFKLKVMLVNALRRFRESLRRVTDGAEAFLILTLFILCLDKVSTDHAKLVPLSKVCTAKETLEKNTAKGTKCKLEPLISLTDDLSLLSKMAALESCPKHNMIAYLEKTKGNVEFHEVIDFLRRSYIYHALTVSPVVSTTFVEQFWTSAKSKTINNVRHITAKVAGKFVSISEASIRTDLIFDDADGIELITKSSLLDAIQLMGYEVGF